MSDREPITTRNQMRLARRVRRGVVEVRFRTVFCEAMAVSLSFLITPRCQRFAPRHKAAQQLALGMLPRDLTRTGRLDKCDLRS